MVKHVIKVNVVKRIKRDSPNRNNDLSQEEQGNSLLEYSEIVEPNIKLDESVEKNENLNEDILY